MHTLKIQGVSDDLIRCEGGGFDISEEFEVQSGDFHPASGAGPSWLAISDGTLLGVNYDDDCIWRLKAIVQGAGTRFEKVEGTAKPDTESDCVTLISETPFKWVLLGRNLMR